MDSIGFRCSNTDVLEAQESHKQQQEQQRCTSKGRHLDLRPRFTPFHSLNGWKQLSGLPAWPEPLREALLKTSSNSQLVRSCLRLLNLFTWPMRLQEATRSYDIDSKWSSTLFPGFPLTLADVAAAGEAIGQQLAPPLPPPQRQQIGLRHEKRFRETWPERPWRNPSRRS